VFAELCPRLKDMITIWHFEGLTESFQAALPGRSLKAVTPIVARKLPRNAVNGFFTGMQLV
jgi:hypothetical protein